MVGPVDVTDTALSRWGGSVELTGPVSRAAMREHFAWADVFLLPSLCEGSAVSVYEALSAGLPVVCTPSTGSVVVDGVDGYIVPTRDVGAIVDRLQRLHRDRDLMAAMSQSAASRLSSYSFASYARRLCEALSSAADHNSPVQSAPAA